MRNNAVKTARGMSNPNEVVTWKPQKRRRFSERESPATYDTVVSPEVTNGQNQRFITSAEASAETAP